MKVVWVMPNAKERLPLGFDNRKVMALDWAPQAEVLSHNAVRAGLTHCGTNSCIDFINAGVPVLTFPHHDE